MLNLNDFLVADDVIKWKDEEFVVTAEIPAKDFAKSYELQELKEEIGDKMDVRLVEKLQEWLKTLLYVKNDKDRVNGFIDSLSLPNLSRVSVHITGMINGEQTAKKNSD